MPLPGAPPLGVPPPTAGPPPPPAKPKKGKKGKAFGFRKPPTNA
jgi:hypothetical protein